MRRRGFKFESTAVEDSGKHDGPRSPTAQYVDDDSWTSIDAYHTRLSRAVDAEGRPQSSRTMKDLIETIDKVILTLRGEVNERAVDFHEVVRRAQSIGLTLAGPYSSPSAFAFSISVSEIIRSSGSPLSPVTGVKWSLSIYGVGLPLRKSRNSLA